MGGRLNADSLPFLVGSSAMDVVTTPPCAAVSGQRAEEETSARAGAGSVGQSVGLLSACCGRCGGAGGRRDQRPRHGQPWSKLLLALSITGTFVHPRLVLRSSPSPEA
jgi:hypothetical protein